MVTLVRTYDNGEIKHIIVSAAIYGNEEHTSVVMITDNGDVAVSMEDTPDLWSQLLASEIQIVEFVPDELIQQPIEG